ncbi:MAG: long-chain fatty acid--CoA ligase [Muribaculaceae bacterium]|nr:long-chain fatty acid--CoA ligase [Muribaculaceae bacterium]
MNKFLMTDSGEYSYSQLLASINERHVYYPLYKQKDLYLFFENLIKALVNNAPLVLMDADLNKDEISDIDESKVNVVTAISAASFSDMNALVEAVKASTSEITIFTSGTTGQPKKVIHSVKSLTRAVRTGDKYKGQVWAYAYNPTHMAGLQVFFQAFMNQNLLVNVFNKTRAEVFAKIEANDITHCSATPTFYRLLLPFEKSFDSVIRVTLGGEKSDNHLYENIHKIFPNARINNVYASTEAGTLFATKGDCFQIPPAIRENFRIQDEELLIHKSLLGQSDSFKFDGDFYHSGDLIEWVDQSTGLFRFKSRKNELINVGGYKVNPGEVEDAINAIEGIQQSLVYGKPNSILGNILIAEILLEEGASITDIEIRKILKEQLQDFKIPRKIKFVETFSLTRTGKLKRS